MRCPFRDGCGVLDSYGPYYNPLSLPENIDSSSCVQVLGDGGAKNLTSSGLILPLQSLVQKKILYKPYKNALSGVLTMAHKRPGLGTLIDTR